MNHIFTKKCSYLVYPSRLSAVLQALVNLLWLTDLCGLALILSASACNRVNWERPIVPIPVIVFYFICDNIITFLLSHYSKYQIFSNLWIIYCIICFCSGLFNALNRNSGHLVVLNDEVVSYLSSCVNGTGADARQIYLDLNSMYSGSTVLRQFSKSNLENHLWTNNLLFIAILIAEAQENELVVKNPRLILGGATQPTLGFELMHKGSRAFGTGFIDRLGFLCVNKVMFFMIQCIIFSYIVTYYVIFYLFNVYISNV